MTDTVLETATNEQLSYQEQILQLFENFGQEIEGLTNDQTFAELLQNGKDRMSDHDQRLSYHNSRHAEQVDTNFSNFLDELNITLDKKQQDQLKKIGKLLAWYHDADLHTLYGNPQGLTESDEDHSAQILRSNIFPKFKNAELGSRLDKFVSQLEAAIKSTKVHFNGGIRQFSGQTKEGDSFLADLLCASDLGYFSANIDTFMEFSLRYGLENSGKGKNIVMNSDTSNNDWKNFWKFQIDTLSNYHFPQTLAPELLTKLEDGKKNNIDYLQKIIDTDQGLPAEYQDLYQRLLAEKNRSSNYLVVQQRESD